MKHSAVKRNPIAPRGRRGKAARSVEDLRAKTQPDAEGYEEFMKSRLFRPLGAIRAVWRVDYRTHAGLKRQAIGVYVSQTEPIAPWGKPALSREFLSYFGTGNEYFFER